MGGPAGLLEHPPTDGLLAQQREERPGSRSLDQHEHFAAPLGGAHFGRETRDRGGPGVATEAGVH